MLISEWYLKSICSSITVKSYADSGLNERNINVSAEAERFVVGDVAGGEVEDGGQVGVIEALTMATASPLATYRGVVMIWKANGPGENGWGL